MFTFTQIMVSRPQFILEKLDIRRLLSVSIAADVAGEVEATEATEVIADEAMIEETFITDDVIMYKGDEGEVDPAMYELEILTMEEPLENLEDVPAEDDWIRYTMIPMENQRNLDGEPVENLEDCPTPGCGFGELPEVEILVIDEEPLENLEDTPADGEIITFGEGDPDVLMYATGSPLESVGSTELPPPPSQSSAFAGALTANSLSDDVLDSDEDDVLAS